MIDLQPVPADFTPRPKRKYTVTDRVLAACRANLERANAVPREIRFRSTEKRRLACHRNLTLAVIAKKRDRSPRYATCFRNGWYVADPERALGLVGATPEEYHQHLEAWRREINPRDATEEKLAHALGMLSWRWIAGLRLECDLEALKIFRMLEALAAERRPGGPDAEPLPLTEEELSGLGYALEEALAGSQDLLAPLERIRDRMLRLWQELLRWRGEPLMDLKGIGCFGRRHEVAIDHPMHSPFELAEPFRSCERTEATLCPRPDPVRPVEQWANPPSSGGAELHPRLRGDDVAGPRCTSDDVIQSAKAGIHSPAALAAAGGASGAFLRQVRPADDLAMLRQARRQGWELPGDFESFFHRVQAAIGMEEPRRGAEDAAAATVGSAAAPACKRWTQGVRRFAHAVWNSLQALRRQADDLLARLSQNLGNYLDSLWPKNFPRPQWTARQMLHRSVTAVMDEPERRTERRGEDLAQFYRERVTALADALSGRWKRCKAAMAVVWRGGTE